MIEKPVTRAIVPSTTSTTRPTSGRTCRSASSGTSEPTPYLPIVNAIAPNAPIGASCDDVHDAEQHAREPSMKSVTTLPRSPRCASTLPNSSAISSLQDLALRERIDHRVRDDVHQEVDVDCPCAFAA